MEEGETEAKNDSYTVENFNGVPFIAKNGKPVRGRMFLGGYPGDNRYSVENDSWSDISIKFTSPHSGQIGVRFLFETLAKDVYAKYIRLVCVEDGNVQTLYDTSKENKDTALFADKKQLCSIQTKTDFYI